MNRRNLKGLRCRSKTQIRTYAGNVEPFSEGTIISEMNNLGRRILEIRWDHGVCTYVFVREIEILDDLTDLNGFE